MKSKFKIGDRVVIVAAKYGHGMHIGETTTLSALYPSGDHADNGKKFLGWKNTSNGSYICENEFKAALPAEKVKFLLRYDLKTDPIEEFVKLSDVKARVEELVKNKDKNGLKLDSIVVYELKKTTKIIVETQVTIKGI